MKVTTAILIGCLLVINIVLIAMQGLDAMPVITNTTFGFVCGCCAERASLAQALRGFQQ